MIKDIILRDSNTMVNQMVILNHQIQYIHYQNNIYMYFKLILLLVINYLNNKHVFKVYKRIHQHIQILLI